MVRVAGDGYAIEPCLLLFLRHPMYHGIYQHFVAVILGGRGMVLNWLLTRLVVLDWRRSVSVSRPASLIVGWSSMMVLVVAVTTVVSLAPLSTPVLSWSEEGGRGPSIVHVTPMLIPVLCLIPSLK